MAIFGRKSAKKEFVPPVDVKEISEMSFNRQPIEHRSRAEEFVPRESPQDMALAPVFIKLTKYRQVLSALNQLKMNVNLIKNQVAVMGELDKLRDENIKLLKSALGKVDERLASLDSSFMRPSGYEDDLPEARRNEVDSLDCTIDDLKSQIDNLRSEVETAY